MREPRILIVTPFRNESLSVKKYLDGLRALDYPPDLIDLYWLENDSTDRTVKMLHDAKTGMPFRTSLESVRIIGPQAKKPPGGYVKDVPYGGRRVKPWIVLWNRYFLPRALKSGAEYIALYMADCVPPPHTFKAYLEVFEAKEDAGWVGGAMHRRYPYHDLLFTPWLKGHRPPSLKNQPVPPTGVAEVEMASPHCCMILVNALRGARCSWIPGLYDVHMSIANHVRSMGLKVYYTDKVYLLHVSSDGKIHRHHLNKPDPGRQ